MEIEKAIAFSLSEKDDFDNEVENRGSQALYYSIREDMGEPLHRKQQHRIGPRYTKIDYGATARIGHLQKYLKHQSRASHVERHARKGCNGTIWFSNKTPVLFPSTEKRSSHHLAAIRLKLLTERQQKHMRLVRV